MSSLSFMAKSLSEREPVLSFWWTGPLRTYCGTAKCVLTWDTEVHSSLGKYMFVLSGLWCGQLRAVVRGSAADDGDDSAAYWPVTLLSTVIAALTDTDHPLSSGQNTFIILGLFFPPVLTSQPEGRKIYAQHAICTFHFWNEGML